MSRTGYVKAASGVLRRKLPFAETIAVVLILYLILLIIPWRFSWVDLFSNFLAWILLPAIPVLIYMLIRRRWITAALWAVPSIFFVVFFGALFLPALGMSETIASGSGSQPINLRVMTFNMYGHPPAQLQRQIDLIINSGADIISLQEVSRTSATVIESELADIYPYRVVYPEGIAGSGLLSKYPIENHEFFVLHRGLLYHCRATVNIDGHPVTVISAHPPPPLSLQGYEMTSVRYDEVKRLTEMATQGGPALMMGDFNMTDQSVVYRLPVIAGLHDTFREVGWGFGLTWPMKAKSLQLPFPLMRIDYIWHTDEFQPVSCHVGRRALSDHLPVIADIVFIP